VDFYAIATIARQELLVNVRSRWTLIFAAAFGSLVLAISYFGLITAATVGFQGFARTCASLLNLVLYVIPLLALVMGTLSFNDEKGSNELLFSQPVSRMEILLGKLGGLFASIAAATLLGFGVAGIVIAAKTGSESAFSYPLFVALALFLALIFLSVAVLLSAVCRGKANAFGLSLFVWFFFVILYDLLVMGGTFLLKERSANTFIFLSLFGNPVDMIRVAGLMLLDGKEVFGAAGALLLRFLGGEGSATLLLLLGLTGWVVLPVLISVSLLKRRDI
jgi:Cu-processing system permease protein